MSKLALALGKDYQEHRQYILTRKYELCGHTFKVKVPSVAQIESIYNYFKTPDDAVTESIYQDLIKDIKDVESDTIQKKDDDIILEGRSMREAAKNKNVLQYRIVEYFKFLVGENNESLQDITYVDIEIEFPFAIQLNIVEKINEVISPDYKEIRSK
jgi:hypothetical protein